MQERRNSSVLAMVPALVQIMAWHQPGNKHYLNHWWLDYWCIYASLSLNELNSSQKALAAWNTQLHNIPIITNSNPPKHEKMIISNLSISLPSFRKTKKWCRYWNKKFGLSLRNKYHIFKTCSWISGTGVGCTNYEHLTSHAYTSLDVETFSSSAKFHNHNTTKSNGLCHCRPHTKLWGH